MKYLVVTLEFFKEYWPEIRRAAGLTVELWPEVIKLAPTLAAKWRDAALRQAQDAAKK
ncbi:MAG: hypothetical protein BroJett011_03860 [Chloroflexota bacterium]|nr:MAG: hypothetical protein BroJett011_03860 [Chloroflexota bacterium]